VRCAQTVRRVSIACSDAQGKAYVYAAIDAGHRAVNDLG
jgi:hypothetical protein